MKCYTGFSGVEAEPGWEERETPAGLPGYRWVDGGAQPLASFCRKPRPPLQQLTSSRELSGAIRAWSPPVGANAGSVWGHRGQYHISEWPSQKNRPLCLLAQPEGSGIGKALIWTMGTLSALNPRCPLPQPLPTQPPTSFPLKLMRCNFTYMMGNRGFRMTAVAEPFLQLTARRQVVFCKAELFLTSRFRPVTSSNQPPATT